MKTTKLYGFVLFFVFFQTTLFAQTYVRILRDGDYTLRSDGRKIKLFEGEIYELFSKESESKLKNGKKGILLKFDDSQLEVPWGSGSKQTYEYPVTVSTDTATLYKENKHKFVQQSALDSNTYVYDLSLIDTEEQISIASQTVKEIIRVKTKRKDKFTAEYFRKHFANRYVRIIVPSYPTLIIDANDITITQTQNPTAQAETDDSESNPEEQFEPASSRNDWKFILGVMALILIGLLLYVNRNRLLGMRETPENSPITRNTNKGNLRNTPKKKSEVRPQQGKSEEETEQDEPEEKADSTKEPEAHHVEKSEIENPESGSLAEKNLEKQQDLSPEEIAEFLNPDEITEKLPQELAPVVLEQSPINSKVLEAVIEEKEALNQEVVALRQENTRLQQALDTQQAQQLGLPPHLMPYYMPFCEFNQELIEFMEQTEHMANRFYEQCVRQNSQEEKSVIEVILFRFLQQKNKLKMIGFWKDVLSELEKGNVWQDEILDIIFNPQLSDSQKLAILQNDIFVQVHQPYLSAILLLAEEMRCVGHFTGFEFALSQEMQDYFAKAIKQICEVADQKIGHKVHYVPLFARPETTPDALVKIVPPFALTAIYDRVNPEAGLVKSIRKYGIDPDSTEIMLA